MKTPAGSRISVIFIASLFFVNSAFSQIEIAALDSISPVDMVENIVGEGVQFENVQYQGAAVASGTFTNGSTTNLGIQSGIFLTSGLGYLIPGPNSDCGAGINNNLGGDPLLDALTPSLTYDASVLQFDFVPESDTLRFKYVFGSEEYNENVTSNLNDVFGFFISGPDPDGGNYSDLNIAVVPGTVNTPITINNINNGYSACGTVPTGPCTNCEFYYDNTNGLTIEYDGFTNVLIAFVKVIPCETYHIKMGVADAGDHVYDTGIFIEENSFESPKIDVQAIPYPQGISDNMIEGCVEAELIFELPKSSYAPVTINWDMSGSTADPAAYPPGDFEEAIPDHITFNEGADSASLHVVPVKDGIIEGPEVLQLIIENTLGCIVRYDTVEFTIVDYVDMLTQTSPNMVICEGQTVNLSVNAFNGIPPYTFEWEGFSINNDTLSVTPASSTLYRVNVMDLCQDTVTDSTLVTVLPDYLNEMLTFSFLASSNPILPGDITGMIANDSVWLEIPEGTNTANLVADFNISNCAEAFVNGTPQESGITPNDFTNPVTYQVIAQNGAEKDWVVTVDFTTGINKSSQKAINVYPNPSHDQLSIEHAGGWECSVLNTLGLRVWRHQIPDSKFILDVGSYEPGIYFLKFESEDKVLVRRVVICR